MKSALAVIALLWVVVACRTPDPPAGSGAPTGTGVGGRPGSIFLVSVVDDERPFFDVRVDAVAPDGVPRTIANFTNVHPAAWDGAAPIDRTPILVGPDRKLVVAAERNGGAAPDDLATLVLDLHDPGRPPFEIPGEVWRTAWGPNGELARFSQTIELFEPEAGTHSIVAPPEKVSPVGTWVQDGSGWLASRPGAGGPPQVGVLSRDGTFTAGRARSFEVTGLERWLGDAGGMLGIAFSDGATSSETVLIEVREDLMPPCQCLVWVRARDPGSDPKFGPGVWDATGTGIWVPMDESGGGGRWLSHITTPDVDAAVARLPEDGDWTIVGVSPDDAWVVLAGEEAGAVVRVDTKRGQAEVVGRNGPRTRVSFAGWLH